LSGKKEKKFKKAFICWKFEEFLSDFSLGKFLFSFLKKFYLQKYELKKKIENFRIRKKYELQKQKIKRPSSKTKEEKKKFCSLF